MDKITISLARQILLEKEQRRNHEKIMAVEINDSMAKFISKTEGIHFVNPDFKPLDSWLVPKKLSDEYASLVVGANEHTYRKLDGVNDLQSLIRFCGVITLSILTASNSVLGNYGYDLNAVLSLEDIRFMQGFSIIGIVLGSVCGLEKKIRGCEGRYLSVSNLKSLEQSIERMNYRGCEVKTYLLQESIVIPSSRDITKSIAHIDSVNRDLAKNEECARSFSGAYSVFRYNKIEEVC